MNATTPQPAPPRARCQRCWRPQPLCWCADLPTVATRTRVVVLQHPHERTHPFGTARLLRLCLPTASVHVPWAGFTGTLEQRVDVPPDTVVLYPRPDAPLLDELPGPPPSTLLLLDATWAHARRLYRENGWLQALRHARLVPAAPSRYRIRQEPRADYVSTVEAAVQALRLLEPDTPDLEALLHAFDRMIDRQIGHAADVVRFGRRKLPRCRPSRALSPLLADARLIVAYAESALPGGDPSASRELVQWVATRVADGETFEALLRPAGAPPSAHHLRHMGIAASDLAAGETHAAARARFHAFAGEAPLAAWTTTTLDWGAPLLPPGAATTVLKTNYVNLANRRAGLLEQVVQREGLLPVPTGCRGRAGNRLGNALAVARWLQQRAGTTPCPAPR